MKMYTNIYNYQVIPTKLKKIIQYYMKKIRDKIVKKMRHEMP